MPVVPRRLAPDGQIGVEPMSATATLATPLARETAPPLIALERVEKVYRTGKLEYPALRGVDLEIDAGECLDASVPLFDLLGGQRSTDPSGRRYMLLCRHTPGWLSTSR